MNYSSSRDIKKFFKNNATVGQRIYRLYHLFKEQHETKLTYEEFEQSLLDLKKKCALELKERCQQYIEKNGPNGYDKFVLEEEYVSKKLWDKISWETTSASIVATLSPRQKESKSENEVSHATHPASQEMDTPESDTRDKYSKLLPVNWTKMDLSERIDFTKKVQHVGFFQYILDVDKNLKNYFTKLSNPGPERTKLYVTIFSIPSGSYSEEAKSLLRTFVNSLNMTGRAKLQYIQCSEPDMVEIREVR
jgi:hypothetical protein